MEGGKPAESGYISAYTGAAGGAAKASSGKDKSARRASLSAVYGATELFFVQDKSPANEATLAFLKDRLGERILPAGVDLIDDPFRIRGLGSTPFDDEGVAVSRQSIVRDGVLTTWLLNSSAAAQLGLASTGHASRGLAGPPGVSTHNLHLEPGERDLAGLMADAAAGLLVTSMFGPSLNANTGDWSAGVSGFWFEDGQIVWPVSGVTVAGNLAELWTRLERGSDLEFRGGFNSPSLMFDGVAIAGK